MQFLVLPCDLNLVQLQFTQGTLQIFILLLNFCHIVRGMQGCTPSYYNNEGKPGEISRQNGFFLGAPMEFMELLENFRKDGELKGLTLA